ncbi:MAG: inorganic diphosphatase [Elusimicrobiota bacterium]|jgi:inorganic pyrophosphatase|nr:inorganic diphosphatase [Elusimicrobiota bacterium]
MNVWHDIDRKRISEKKFVAVIEISKGTQCKYELDKETGFLKLDRVLYTSMHYPANYGFIPLTYAEDNDPLDVLVLCSQKILPLTLVECYPIGVIDIKDNDETDKKIIAIPSQDPSLNQYKDISELPIHTFEEIRHFFEVYKNLELKKVVVERILGKKNAEKIIEKSIKIYKEKFCK